MLDEEPERHVAVRRMRAVPRTQYRPAVVMDSQLVRDHLGGHIEKLYLGRALAEVAGDDRGQLRVGDVGGPECAAIRHRPASSERLLTICSER